MKGDPGICGKGRRATQEYVAAVMKAREVCDAAHAVEQGVRRQGLQDDDHGDPVVCLLSVTQQVACAQCEKAVDVFLSSIKKTFRKHMPPHAQGPLISNALSTAFQFQNECVAYGRHGVHLPGVGKAL